MLPSVIDGPGACLVHSMTSSACVRSDGGTVMPRALAVFRLIASSNLLGCSTKLLDKKVPYKETAGGGVRGEARAMGI